MRKRNLILMIIILSMPFKRLNAESGTEAASFLNIPVGAEPAAMGAAYSALANNAYATTWNPGALGQVADTQVAAQHLNYLEAVHYEYASFARPFGKKKGFGAAIQYLGSGDIQARDEFGTPTGSFDGHYGAYAIGYGQSLTKKLSVGLSGKIIEGKIDTVSASAYAVDFGSYFQATKKLTLAGVVNNIGSKMKFIDQADSLPLAVRLGGAYQPNPKALLSFEGVYRKTGLASAHAGLEWRPVHELALRVGYRTDTIDELSGIAGLTTGIGINVFGQSLSYSWVPLGELGNTQYFSFLFHFR